MRGPHGLPHFRDKSAPWGRYCPVEQSRVRAGLETLDFVKMKILVYPHEVLRKPARRVESVDRELQQIIDRMFETMYRAKGIGLAANQVGLPVQLVVMDVSGDEQPEEPLVLINPVIIAREGEETAEEGCLSVPGYGAPIKRSSAVQVKALDRNEHEIIIDAEGLMARCIQHELDHLRGLCFVDLLNPVKKALFRKKWAKIRPEDK